MSIYFKNQLRGYNVVIATLQAFSKDICKNCIGLEGTKTKVIKGLKKLKIDLENSDLSEAERKEILTSMESFSDTAEQIDVAEDCECQKTAGNCKIGPACLAFDGAWALMKQITEPELIAANPEPIAASKVVDVRQACCIDTLATPIKDAIKGMKAGEVLEVIIPPSLKEIFNTFIEQEKYPILEETGKGEEVHFKIKLK
jgi:TusA-related sulfurtransferase